LYEVDRIINRAVVHGLLAAILTVVTAAASSRRPVKVRALRV
jgi:hypothetical protein